MKGKQRRPHNPEQGTGPQAARAPVQQPRGNAAAAEMLAQRPAGVGGDATAWVEGMASTAEGATAEVGPPRAQVEDASAEQEPVVTAAVERAKMMAQVGLGALQGGGDGGLAEKWFDAADPGKLQPVVDVMKATHAGLNGDFAIQVEGWAWPWPWGSGKDVAYVYTKGLQRHSDIHLTPRFFTDLTPDRQASTILHEATHKWGGTTDVEYIAAGESPGLDYDQAVMNADSYAGFADEALHGVEAERAARDKRLERALAEQHRAAIWAAHQAGELLLGEDGFAPEDSERVRPELVADAVLKHFEATRPADYEEAVEASVSEFEYGRSYECASGFVVRDDLFQLLSDQNYSRW